MKNAKTLWAAGLALLLCTAGAAYWYTVNYMKWNVPLYGVSMALLFLLGAAGFALLAAAKGKTKKQLLPPALLGGLGTTAGVFIISFVINVLLFHEHGARFAALATAAFGCALALYGVLRLKKLTGAKPFRQALPGVLLALGVFAAGFAGIVFSGCWIPAKDSTDALRKAAATELAAAEKLYGTDALQTENGTLTVAFIGGSLTEGRITYEKGKPRSTNAWTNDVLTFLAEKYPQKTLRAVNAGKGGTNSAYGAARFGHDVEPYAPDLLFIEFSVNDCGSLSCKTDDSGAAETQIYLEYMLRRCLQMKKEPVVIYLHTPYPTNTETELSGKWREGADLKTALCEHYGVPVIDIYQKMQEIYGSAGTDLPLEDWLAENGWYYRAEGGGLDVHPSPDGYRAFYSAAVVGALENDWVGLIRQPTHAPIYCQNGATYLNGAYSYVDCTDPRLSFSDGWRTYTSRFALWMNPSQDSVPYAFLEYPHYEEGVAQVKSCPGAYFTYETDAGALGMAIVSSLTGCPQRSSATGRRSARSAAALLTAAWISPPERSRCRATDRRIKSPFGSTIPRTRLICSASAI